MRLENCIYLRLRSENGVEKARASVKGLSNLKQYLFDGLNGIVQLGKGVNPDKAVQRLKSTMMFTQITPVRYFNLD